MALERLKSKSKVNIPYFFSILEEKVRDGSKKVREFLNKFKFFSIYLFTFFLRYSKIKLWKNKFKDIKNKNPINFRLWVVYYIRQWQITKGAYILNLDFYLEYREKIKKKRKMCK